MITITTLRRDSDEFVIVPAPAQTWTTEVPGHVRARLKQASTADKVFRGGRRLFLKVAPFEGRLRIPDEERLQGCLQSESQLYTDDPDTPWELMAWGDVTNPQFWGTARPVVRGRDEKPLREPSSGMSGPLTSLIVVSDPDDDLGLRSEREDEIKALNRHLMGAILWNPQRNEVIEEIATGHGFLIFIGHAEYDDNDPDQSKYYLSGERHLTPDDLRSHLSGRPVVLFIACVAGQHAPEDRGIATMPAMGFMPACLDRGATAFIGPLWEIKVDGGLWVAERLVRHLRSHPPGEALRRTRRDALEDTSQDATWAAFVVYQGPQPRGEPPDPWEKAVEHYKRRDFDETIKALRQLAADVRSEATGS